MKLTAQKYESPKETEGTFFDVEIRDVKLEVSSKENYLAIHFEMSHVKNSERKVIETAVLAFLGNEDDEVSSNRTTTISIPDPNQEGERLQVNMLDYFQEFGIPEDYKMVDWGYPTAEKAKQMFSGGTLQNPEVQLSDFFAQAWLLNTLVFKGQLVGVQFNFEA